jgi:hypothetical protein
MYGTKNPKDKRNMEEKFKRAEMNSKMPSNFSDFCYTQTRKKKKIK